MVTIGESTKIDKAAQLVLQDNLNESKGWILRSESPDYHVDYCAELIDCSDPSGKRILIQLKGTKKINCSKEQISFSMRVKHLLYYLQNAQLPVFLIVVDTTNSKGYFLFLQKYLDELESDTWKTSKKKRIKIPLRNLLSDRKLFLDEAHAACDFLNEKHPGSPRAAIKRKEAILHSLDNRLDYRIDVIAGKEVVQLKTRPGHDVTLVIKGEPDDLDAAKEIMGYGKPGKIEFKDIQVLGSPVFEQFKGDNSLATFNVDPVKVGRVP